MDCILHGFQSRCGRSDFMPRTSSTSEKCSIDYQVFTSYLRRRSPLSNPTSDTCVDISQQNYYAKRSFGSKNTGYLPPEFRILVSAKPKTNYI